MASFYVLTNATDDEESLPRIVLVEAAATSTVNMAELAKHFHGEKKGGSSLKGDTSRDD